MPVRTLRWLAVLGMLAALVGAAAQSFPLQPRQSYGFLLLAVLGPAVLVAILVLMPGAVGELWRHPDLLVPLGVYLLAEQAILLLGNIPLLSASLADPSRLPFPHVKLQLSVVLLLSLAAAVAYHTWATCLILDTVRRDRCDPGAALAAVPRWFWRIAGLEAIFVGGLVLTVVGILWTSAGTPGRLGFLTIAMTVLTVILNFATAALLPTAIDERLGFRAALQRGLRRSWRSKSRWSNALLAQLLLLGVITFVSVSFQESGDPDRKKRNTMGQLNAIWTGGYESESRWYPLLTKALETQKVPLPATSLAMVFGLLAIAVKITVVRELREPQD